MPATRFDDFNTLVLKLYRAAAETELESYQDTALDILKPLLPFDGAMWGTASFLPGVGIDIHTIHLHNQSPDMVAEYEAVKHLDTSAALVTGKPHMTKGFHSPSWFDGGPRWNDYRDWQRRHGHENVFITAATDQRTGATQWLSLFRADGDHHCRAEEVHLLSQLSQHVMQGLQHNRILHLGRLNSQAGAALHEAAVADARGTLYHATPGCEEMLRGEWGTAVHAGCLPAPLLNWLRTTDTPFMGRTLVARRQVRKDLLFVHLRPLCTADSLAPRQREAAELVAQGLTHKQAAQRLGLSPATVRNQMQEVYRKLDVQNVAALVQALRQAQW